MRPIHLTAASKHILPVALLAMATALGGCVGYTTYPPVEYSYTAPTGYYSAYPRTYSYANDYHPFYTSNYNGYYNTYASTAGNGN